MAFQVLSKSRIGTRDDLLVQIDLKEYPLGPSFEILADLRTSNLQIYNISEGPVPINTEHLGLVLRHRLVVSCTSKQS